MRCADPGTSGHPAPSADALAAAEGSPVTEIPTARGCPLPVNKRYAADMASPDRPVLYDDSGREVPRGTPTGVDLERAIGGPLPKDAAATTTTGKVSP